MRPYLNYQHAWILVENTELVQRQGLADKTPGKRKLFLKILDDCKLLNNNDLNDEKGNYHER